jgi:hypothetical protein
MARSPDEIRKESYDFWTGAIPGVVKPYRPNVAYAIGAMQNGETSYRWPFPIGDHGRAFGGFQWQQVRANDILVHTGTNVTDPNLSNLDCLKAADWEMTHSAHYHRVRPILEVLHTIEAAVAILVCLYEQSLEQPRDITRRMNLAMADTVRVGPGAE